MTNSDPLERLLARAESGDETVVPALLEHCRTEMEARLGRRPHANEAEDVVQDAMLQAIGKLDGFAWQGWAALRTWLWSFVENAYADRCKYHAACCRQARRAVEEGPSGGSRHSNRSTTVAQQGQPLPAPGLGRRGRFFLLLGDGARTILRGRLAQHQPEARLRPAILTSRRAG